MKNTTFLLLFIIVVFGSSCASQRVKQQKYLKKNFIELKAEVPEAQVTLLKDTIKVLFPSNVLFEKSSSDLNEEILPAMKRFAGALNKYNKTNILINGYTDNTGSDSLNNSISKDRAATAKSKLINDGVIEKRLFTWGLGNSNPIKPNDNEENRAMNRRVEFIVLYGTEKL